MRKLEGGMRKSENGNGRQENSYYLLVIRYWFQESVVNFQFIMGVLKEYKL